MYTLVAIMLAARVGAQLVAPGFQFLGYGYDILVGNPLDTSGMGDVGYKTNVFTLSDSGEGKTADGKWSIPDKTTAQLMPACSLNLTNQTINNISGYNKALNWTFDITNETQYENESNPVLQKFAFAFNVDTRSVRQDVDVHKMTLFHESFTCASYKLAMASLFDAPPFSSNFLAGVNFLPTEYDDSSSYMFNMFITEFGTHVVTQLISGGRWGWQSEFKYDDVEHISKDGFDFGLGLEIAAKIKAGFEIDVHKELDMASKVLQIMQKNSTFNIGGDFTPDATAWKKSVEDKPMPIHQTLIPIADLLNPFFIKGVEDLDKKRNALKMALTKYCSYLQSTVDATVKCNDIEDQEVLVLV